MISKTISKVFQKRQEKELKIDTNQVLINTLKLENLKQF